MQLKSASRYFWLCRFNFPAGRETPATRYRLSKARISLSLPLSLFLSSPKSTFGESYFEKTHSTDASRLQNLLIILRRHILALVDVVVGRACVSITHLRTHPSTRRYAHVPKLTETGTVCRRCRRYPPTGSMRCALRCKTAGQKAPTRRDNRSTRSRTQLDGGRLRNLRWHNSRVIGDDDTSRPNGMLRPGIDVVAGERGRKKAREEHKLFGSHAQL